MADNRYTWEDVDCLVDLIQQYESDHGYWGFSYVDIYRKRKERAFARGVKSNAALRRLLKDLTPRDDGFGTYDHRKNLRNKFVRLAYKINLEILPLMMGKDDDIGAPQKWAPYQDALTHIIVEWRLQVGK